MTGVSGNGQMNKGYHPALRFPAFIISWIFHPLFIPAYVAGFLFFIHPYAFIGLDPRLRIFKFLSVLVNTALIPGFAVILLWRLKFIQSIFLKTQKERIIPYAIAMIFYFWAWYVSKNQIGDEILTIFLLGSFITVIAAWMANIYFKISMHALSVGALLAYIFWITMTIDGSTGLYPTFAILIAGLVCTARLVVSGHHPVEIYSGFFIGIICQVIAIYI